MKRIRAFPNSPMSMLKAKDEHFRALLSKAKDEQGIKRYQMAEAVRCSKPTFISKVKDPGTMTLAQIRSLADFLHWTAEDLAKFIIGGPKQ